LASLLDTNVISQLTKLTPHEGVHGWLQTVETSSLYLSVVSFTEIRFGIEQMDKGRKRDNFEVWLTSDLREMFLGRIIPVDDRIAEEAGRLIGLATRAGARPELADALIAASARVLGLQLATLNHKHFEKLDVDLVDL
jgi:predicted nucleic acid-binding protein